VAVAVAVFNTLVTLQEATPDVGVAIQDVTEHVVDSVLLISMLLKSARTKVLAGIPTVETVA
jgi:hypothetical protein